MNDGELHPLLAAARSYRAAGLSVIPLRPRDKTPACRWKPYTQNLPTDEELAAWFSDGTNNLGIVCGAISRGLVVLDFDDAENLRKFLHVAPDLERGTRMVATARGGHIWLRTTEPVRPFGVSELRLDVKGSDSYVAAPPSIHPSGKPYEFVNGATEIILIPDFTGWLRRHLQALGIDWSPNGRPLPASPSAERSLQVAATAPSRLSPRMWRLLLDGDTEGAYHSRSEVVMALVQGMVNKGWGEEHVYQALTDPSNAGGAKVQEIRELKGEQAARDYVRGSYKKALDRMIDHPPLRNATDARNLIAHIQQRAESHAWPGTAGASAHATLQALTHIASKVGSSTFSASHRQIAEASGVWRKTAKGAIERLIDGGWLRLLWRGRGRWPSQWKLLDHECEECSTTTPLSPQQRVDNGLLAEQPGDDACRWGGLGKNGCRILELLDPERGMTAGEVAAASKIPPPTARRKLAKLAEHGLATCDRNGLWRRVEKVDLERVASEVGTAGTGERQHRQHERERRQHWQGLGLKADPWTGELMQDTMIVRPWWPWPATETGGRRR